MSKDDVHIQVDPRVESIVMPENVKIGMMVAKYRKKCQTQRVALQKSKLM